PLAGLEVERFNPACQRAWLAVVEISRPVERDQDVVIEISRIAGGVERGRAGLGAPFQLEDVPRTGSEKLLPPDACQCFHYARRPQAGGEADVLGEEGAASLECHGGSGASARQPRPSITNSLRECDYFGGTSSAWPSLRLPAVSAPPASPAR